MCLAKPAISLDTILDFLRETINDTVTGVTPIHHNATTGSQAFSLTVKNTDFILRLGPKLEAFEKDRYASDNFSRRVPIPKVVTIGVLDEHLHFALTVKAPGQVLANLDQATIEGILPTFISLLDDIRSSPLPLHQGYGWWESGGEAYDESWQAYLLSISTVNDNQPTIKQWPQLIREGRVPPKLLRDATNSISNLISYCPEERSLIHGDLHFHNVLTDGRSITGVIDWANSKYGDCLYDVAWLDFLMPSYGFPSIFSRHFSRKGIEMPHYQERIRCYKLHAALDLLKYVASSSQDRLFAETHGKILALLRQE